MHKFKSSHINTMLTPERWNIQSAHRANLWVSSQPSPFYDFYYILIFQRTQHLNNLKMPLDLVLCFEMGKKCYRMHSLNIPSHWLTLCRCSVWWRVSRYVPQLNSPSTRIRNSWQNQPLNTHSHFGRGNIALWLTSYVCWFGFNKTSKSVYNLNRIKVLNTNQKKQEVSHSTVIFSRSN